jgi:mannose-6-phosphate isomerase-like protein (cupin superfamily)
MTKPTRTPIVLAPGQGRTYEMGPVKAVFKADAEVRGRFSVSEWWLRPRTRGPGAHVHPVGEDDLFYVLEGTMSIFIGDRWHDAKPGTLVVAPGGVPHDFENRTGRRAGMLNIAFPGGFEKQMPSIAEWFRARPAVDARTRAREPNKQARTAAATRPAQRAKSPRKRSTKRA